MPTGFDMKCAHGDWEWTRSLKFPNSILFHPKSFSLGVAQRLGVGSELCSEPASFSQWLPDFVSVSVTCFSQSLSLGVISFYWFSHLFLPISRRSTLTPLITNHQIGQLGCCLYSTHHFLPNLITPSFKGLPSRGSLSPMKSHICHRYHHSKSGISFFLLLLFSY